MKTISRMMMTIVLLLVALTVYGQDKHSETYIRQSIATIYQGVGKSTYDADGNRVDYIQSPFNRDSAFCSKQYYALMKQALDICDKTDDIMKQLSPSALNVVTGMSMISIPQMMVRMTRLISAVSYRNMTPKTVDIKKNRNY